MKIYEKESLFILQAPKIIVNIKVGVSQSNNYSSGKIDDNVINFTTNTLVNHTNNKFDKKYKNNTILDGADTKKNKNKLIKKSRKNLNLSKDDLFTDETNNLSLVKQPKFTKNKKKDKYKEVKKKNELDTNISSEILQSRSLLLNKPLTIQELSTKLRVSEADIITYLFLQGISVTINQVIDVLMATDIAKHYKFDVIVDDDDNKFKMHYNISHHTENQALAGNLMKRSPVIAVFGHVDHGKTTLLDTILKTQLVHQEYGGITQSINAYDIEYIHDCKHKNLVFLDTPGHEAFSSMRLRGAQVADIALLVIAADDGLKPQSIEIIQLIAQLQLSYIIVINKIDKATSNIQKVKQELTHYDIMDRDWGGQSKIVEVSALKNQNIDILLSSICQMSESKNLLANHENLAKGTILESYLDRQKGIVAKILVQDGTLEKGHLIIAGGTYGRIKSLLTNQGNQIVKSGPSSIVEILGFVTIPEAGSTFNCVLNDKELKNYLVQFQKENHFNQNKNVLNTRIGFQKNKALVDIKKLNLILKTDTQGALEAVIKALNNLPQTKVQINVISSEAGNISKTDIDLALSSNALIIGFNIKLLADISHLIKRYNLIVNTFNVIYDLLDYVTIEMLALVDIEYDSIILGKATVQTVFPVNKGAVAGCMVNTGKLQKASYINVYRNNLIVYSGKLTSLKRIKENVDEVFQGNECGVMCEEYHLWQIEDIIESYTLKSKEKML